MAEDYKRELEILRGRHTRNAELVNAYRHLEMWMRADEAVATGQSYMIADRSLTRADAAEIRKNLDYWRKKVAELENAEKGGGRTKAYRTVPLDS